MTRQATFALIVKLGEDAKDSGHYGVAAVLSALCASMTVEAETAMAKYLGPFLNDLSEAFKNDDRW